MKAFATKEPNKALYDLHDKVQLICTLDNSSGIIHTYEVFYRYKIEWKKLASDAKLEMYRHSMGGKYISVGPLSDENEGTYRCSVERPDINYYDFQLVDVRIKGNENIYKRLFSYKTYSKPLKPCN